MELIARLLQEQVHVKVYDPQGMEKTKALYPAIQYCADTYEVADGAEALMIVTEWDCFRELDWLRVKRLMQRPLVIDGRNLLDGESMVGMGFEYQGVGQPLAEGVEMKNRAAVN